VRLRAKRAGRALEPETALDPGAIRQAAQNLLARRDYASVELERKLRTRGFEAAAIRSVLQELASSRLLDDDRFVEHFISYHASRGQGPVRIAIELRQRSISTESIDRHLDAVSDWCERARTARRKKFGATVPRDFKSRARQARFLEYRGFSAEHIRAALDGEIETED
jgi:regulatory protein